MFTLIFAATPTPSPTYVGDDAVTPGWVGFLAIFAIALITVFLVIDMTRRIRRVRYREEVRAKLEAEQASSADD